MIIRASAERLFKKNKTEEAGYIVEEVDRLDGIVTDTWILPGRQNPASK